MPLKQGLRRLAAKVRGEGGAEAFESPSSVHDSYAAMGRLPRYRVLLGFGEPLSADDWETVSGDPLLTAALWRMQLPAFLEHFGDGAETVGLRAEAALHRRQRRLLDLVLGRDEQFDGVALRAIIESELLFLLAIDHGKEAFHEALGKRFAMPGPVALVLLDQERRVFRWLLNGDCSSSRVEDFVTRAGNRLQVHLNNHKVLASLAEKESIPKRAYFDIGCLFGLSLVSAVRLGFTVVHGCELDEKVFKRARAIAGWAATRDGLDVRYFEQDFLALPLETQRYTFVTASNVLEHTPDVDKTIAKVAEILAPDGFCYFYQGNARSPRFVQIEPHYKLPLLTILPKELTIQILLRLGAISEPSEYVVTRWPSYTELKEAFVRHGLDATIHPKSLGYWAASEISSTHRARRARRRIVQEAETKIYPLLDEPERRQAEDALAAYFAALEAAMARGTLDDQMAYLKPTWDITIRRAK